MKGLKAYIIAGIIFVSVSGTLLHFAYNWSGNNIFIGLFAPVNESIWEHTKLIFFPMLLYSLYPHKKITAESSCINPAMILGSTFGVILIIVLFYTYSGILGFNFALADISIFYISVVAAFFLAYKASLSCALKKISVPMHFLQIVLICMFIICTLFPPNIPLFANP